MASYDSYIICTSPRSGSTLLCKLLAATGVAGKPASYVHEPSIGKWLEYFDLNPDQATTDIQRLDLIFKAAIAKGTAGTSVFGMRLQRHSFDFFVQQLSILHPRHADDKDRLQAAFGKTLFIHLTRPDKLAQAVSYVKAQQTGLWHVAPDGTELERLAPPQDPAYDRVAIAAEVKKLTQYDQDWAAWFHSTGIAPFRIIYDRLSDDPIEQLRRLLSALGLDESLAQNVRPGVRKLADSLSKEWIERFLKRSC